jgi:hypothetical protein
VAWQWRNHELGSGTKLDLSPCSHCTKLDLSPCSHCTKFDLSPCSHREKVWWRRVMCHSHSTLDGQLHATVALPPRRITTPAEQEAVWAQRRSGRFGRSVVSGASQSNRTVDLRVLPGYLSPLKLSLCQSNSSALPFPVLSRTVTVCPTLLHANQILANCTHTTRFAARGIRRWWLYWGDISVASTICIALSCQQQVAFISCQ